MKLTEEQREKVCENIIIIKKFSRAAVYGVVRDKKDNTKTGFIGANQNCPFCSSSKIVLKDDIEDQLINDIENAIDEGRVELMI